MKKRTRIMLITVLILVLFVGQANAQSFEKVEEKKVKVDDVEANIVIYNDNGVILEALKDIHDGETKKLNKNKQNKIINDLLEQDNRPSNLKPVDEDFQTTGYWMKEQPFYALTTSSQHSDARFRTEGVFDAYRYTMPTKLRLQTDGSFSGHWIGQTKANKIVVSEQYSLSGISVSVSWPPSFNASGTTHTYTSPAVDDVYYLQAYRPDPIVGSTYVGEVTFTLYGRTDIVIGNQVYPATHSITKKTDSFTQFPNE